MKRSPMALVAWSAGGAAIGLIIGALVSFCIASSRFDDEKARVTESRQIAVETVKAGTGKQPLDLGDIEGGVGASFTLILRTAIGATIGIILGLSTGLALGIFIPKRS